MRSPRHSTSNITMVEAGTGTGKSVPILPAIAYAAGSGERVVVSTNTINLQDQLFQKDLPDLQRLPGRAWAVPSRSVAAEGAEQLPLHLPAGRARSRSPLSDDEVRGPARIFCWLPQTRTGDQFQRRAPWPS